MNMSSMSLDTGSSNLTYRVYDYNRVDKNGKKRELHFDKAIRVMDIVCQSIEIRTGWIVSFNFREIL